MMNVSAAKVLVSGFHDANPRSVPAVASIALPVAGPGAPAEQAPGAIARWLEARRAARAERLEREHLAANAARLAAASPHLLDDIGVVLRPGVGVVVMPERDRLSLQDAPAGRRAAPQAGPFAAAVAWLCRQDARYRQRRALAAMDDHQRADLGLSPQDIAAELRRKVWQG